MILAVFLSSRGPQKHPAQDHRNRFRNTGGRSSPQPNPTTRGYKRWTFGSRTRRNALEWVRTAKVRLEFGVRRCRRAAIPGDPMLAVRLVVLLGEVDM